MQSNIHPKNQDSHWLNIAEIVALASSISGSIASVFLQEIILASIPLSACVALNLINRKRLLGLIMTQNDQAIATFSEHNQNDHGNLCDQIMQIQQSVMSDRDKYEIEYENLSQELREANLDSKQDIQKLKSQHAELAAKTVTIAQNTDFNSAELYYQNANGYSQMGEKQKAIQEYTKAIKIDSNYAEAYAGRGMLSNDIGNKQAGIEDLRKSARLYFERGDVDNYKNIKQKIQETYQLNSESRSTSEDQDSEAVLANSLFS